MKLSPALSVLVCFFAGCQTEDSTLVPSDSGADAAAKSSDAAQLHSADGADELMPNLEPIGYVDPFIGTDDGDSPDPVPGDVGGATFPGATVPFGMIQWGPDTPGSEFGYHHRASSISGFSLNHLSGPGCPALMDFPFLPTTEAPVFPGALAPGTMAIPFSHAKEKATPGHYGVELDNGIKVEMTASTRTGFAEFTYPAGTAKGMVVWGAKSPGWGARVDASSVRVSGTNELSGWLKSSGFCNHPLATYDVHFVARFDASIAGWSVWNQNGVLSGKAVEGTTTGVHVTFADNGSDTIRVRTALSFVSEKNARQNLESENADWRFEHAVVSAALQWSTLLDQIKVEGGTHADKRTFYTALYHSLLHPNIASDFNGEYKGFDGVIHEAGARNHYVNFSGWDIYRSWVQLAALLAPRQLSDMMSSMLANAAQCGGLAKWSLANDETGIMVGDPGSILLSTAHAFGVQGFDADKALDVMVNGADTVGKKCNGYELRPGLSSYLEKGYVPVEEWGGAAVTVEYSLADFSIATMAQRLGQTQTAARFFGRASKWKNVFDSETRHIRPRHSTGAWVDPFDPLSSHGFIEGNAVQYSFFVPHDLPGLITALGGKDTMISRLDALFTEVNSGVGRPHFYIGNEPQFSTPSAYVFAGKPARTQWAVNRIIRGAFTDRPSGLPGNDDLGATSSWYVWSAMGLYPAVPGVAGFVLSTPLFRSVVIERSNLPPIRILANKALRNSIYIEGAQLNGRNHFSPWLAWESIKNGGRIDFQLAELPTDWGEGASASLPDFMDTAP